MKTNDILELIDKIIEIGKKYNENININIHHITESEYDEIKKTCLKKYLCKEYKEDKVLRIGWLPEHLRYCSPVTIFY